MILKFTLADRANSSKHHAFIRLDGSKLTLTPITDQKVVTIGVQYSPCAPNTAQQRGIQHVIAMVRAMRPCAISFGHGLEVLNPVYPATPIVSGHQLRLM